MRAHYRVWPAVAVAIAGLVGAGLVVGAQPADAGPTTCTGSSAWVAATQVASGPGTRGIAAAIQRRSAPVLSGCVDLRDVPSVDPGQVPDPRS